MNVTITGIDQAIRNLSPQRLDKPFRDFLTRAAILVQGHARLNAPVDTGRLRSSIAYKIKGGTPPTRAEIGPNVPYGYDMEYGTGVFHEGPRGGSPGYVEVTPALDRWATRHGFRNGQQVAAIINRRGGVKPRAYMRKGLDASRNSINGYVVALGRELAREMGGA